MGCVSRSRSGRKGVMEPMQTYIHATKTTQSSEDLNLYLESRKQFVAAVGNV